MSKCASTGLAIGTLLTRRSERGSEGDSLLSLTQDKGVIPQDEVGRRNISSSNKTKYWRVYPNDIVYNTMRMWQGASARSDYFGIVSPAYTVCCPVSGASSRFLSYALKLPEHIKIFRARSQGLTSDVWNLRFEELAQIELKFVPSYAQQELIATILSSVDGAIEKTQAVIDQVQVVKRGLMQELLTRGLPGQHKRFKQTEIGEIPEEWGIVPLEEFIQNGPENGLYRPQSDYGAGSPIVRIDAFDNGDLLRRPNLRRVAIGPADAARFVVWPGDILINRVNSLSHLAKCALAVSFDEATVYESNMMRLTLDDSRMVTEFGFRWLSSEHVKKHLKRRAKRAVAQASINQNDVLTIPTPCPPRPEQQQIANILIEVEQRIEAETGAVAELKELKSALMSVLLTGELRVTLDTETK